MPPPRLRHRRHRLLPARRVADPDRARDRLGLLDAMRRGRAARRPRPGSRASRALADLLEALPVGGDVARVADRDAERVDRPVGAELLDDLERRGLLALDPERVDGVDERDRVALRTARARARAPRRSCRAARSRARRASAPGRACRWRSCPRARSPRRAARPARRRRPATRRCCRSRRRRTASAPSRTASDTAQVMPRSLNEPVGLAPSSFSQTSAPTRSREPRRAHERRRALAERDDGVVRRRTAAGRGSAR